jgi:hypothetical protein
MSFRVGWIILLLFGLCPVGEGWDYVYPLYTTVSSPQNHLSQYSSVSVHDRIVQLYEKVESRWKTALPIGDPRLSTPPVHGSGESVIPESLRDRGAEAERRNFAINVQPGLAFISGPNGDGTQMPAANGTVGGNFCDEGVLDGRCVILQPVHFDSDYVISGRLVFLLCFLHRAFHTHSSCVFLCAISLDPLC